MPSRSPARFLAPLALGAATVAVLVVLTSSGTDGGDASPTTTAATTAARTTTTPRSTKRRTYVVKSGDTLAAISEKTGVPLARIQQLNPSLDAQTLNVGDKVKLAP